VYSIVFRVLKFSSEDGGSVFLRNVCTRASDCMVLQASRPCSEHTKSCVNMTLMLVASVLFVDCPEIPCPCARVVDKVLLLGVT
jgi:hypothetical protein